MRLTGFHNIHVFYFLLVSISSALARTPHQHDEARDIISQIGSLADSILGISTTQSTDQTSAAALTISPTVTGQNSGTTTATPQGATVVPTTVATSSSGQISLPATNSDSISDSMAVSTAQPTISASMTTDQASSQTVTPSSSRTASTPVTPANPIQGLSSSSTSSSPVKHDNASTVPAAGIAVAVIFGILILAGIAYLLYRYFRSARVEAGTRTPPMPNEPKRFSYSDDGAEQGLMQNPGLGLGKVSDLKRTPNVSQPYSIEPLRTRSRAGSEDSLFLESLVPLSFRDRPEPSLPPIPSGVEESWPVVSPMDSPHPQSLLVKPPAWNTRPGHSGTGYTPYRREGEVVIGVAVPFERSHIPTIQNARPSPVISSQTHEAGEFEIGRRISGAHELS